MQRILKVLGACLLVPTMLVAANTVSPEKAEAQWGSYGYRYGSNYGYRPSYRYGYRNYGYRPYGYRSYGYRPYYNRGFYGGGYYNRGYFPRYGVSTPYGSFYWR